MTDPLDNESATDGIVASTRVRLARNLKGHLFPGWSRKEDRLRAMNLIRTAVESCEEMQGGFSQSMDQLSALEKQVLVERHLISREHAARNTGSALVINRASSLAVMINEEDHLRIQAILPGFQLREVYKTIDALDTRLAGLLPFAFSSRLGFLTACPTNVGTGMRASAMLHLPALVLAEHMGKIIQAVNKLGLVVRGLYGEGTEAFGNLFQISNQMTLGEKESDILARLEKVVLEIVRHEVNARTMLLEKSPRVIYDHVGRAYGILANAHTITSKEAMNLLSMISLGTDLGLFGDLPSADVQRLFMETQPAHLQRSQNREKLPPEERDGLRADMLREGISGIRPPNFGEKRRRRKEPPKDPS